MKNKTQLITDLIIALYLSKGRNNPPEDLILVWYGLLSDYKESELIYAFNQEMKTKHEFITVGRIIEWIDPEKDISIEAGDNWLMVIDAVNSGPDMIIALPDYLKEFICTIFGGFLPLKGANEIKLRILEKRFIASFKEKKQNADKNTNIIKIEEKINPQIEDIANKITFKG